MSLKVMTWAWTVRLPPTPKLVLMALADEADDRGFCFPSQRHLADKCNIDERTVRRMIALLRELEHVGIEQRFRKDRGRTSNGYRLAFDIPRTNCPGVPDSADRGERTGTPGGRGHSCPGAPDTVVRVTTTYPCIYPDLLLPDVAHAHASAPVGDGSGGLCFPEGLSRTQQEALRKMLAGVQKESAQQVLDELAGRMKATKVRNPIHYCAALVRRLKQGTFVADIGVRIAEERRREQAPDRAQQRASDLALKAQTTQLPRKLQTLLERVRRNADGTPRDKHSDDDTA
jgi:hypothetical protein